MREALFANPYQRVWGAAGEPPLPIYDVTLSGVLRGILPFGRPYIFRQATERAVDSNADLRWGADRKGFRRLLHPNGICLTGLWQITEETSYSGCFRQGSQALIVGRYSTCCTKTRRGHDDTTPRFSRKIVNRCLETGQSVLSEDASSDKQFDLSQSIADCRIRSVMLAPLLSRTSGKAFGVIQLDTQDRSKKFSQEDLNLLVCVANQASVALENARFHE